MPDAAPAWLATMRQITGTHALHDNPIILGWAKKIGELFPDTAQYCAGYTHDTIAWCGLTVGYCMAINGIKPVFGPTDTDRFLWADAWRQFGSPVTTTPQLGDVLVFQWSTGGHHVTLYEQTQGDLYVCRGGNQSNEVNVSSFPKSRCTAVLRPPAASASVVAAAAAATATASPGGASITGITATAWAAPPTTRPARTMATSISDSELGVALPARFPGSSRPQVQVWNGGKSVLCNIVDVGPWNTNDPYWQTGSRPQAESGKDMQGRPTNGAGIDLTPAAARAIGIDGKGTVDWAFADATTGAITVATSSAITLPPLAPLQQLIMRLESLMTTTPASPSTWSTPTATTTPANPPAQPDLAALIQQIITLVQTLNPPAGQGGAATAPKPQDVVNQIVTVLNTLVGGQPALGQVNGALGQTLGDLLNGKKSAIGIIGALITAVLQVAGPSLPLSSIIPGLGTAGAAGAVAAAGSTGLGSVLLPIFLAIAAWGVLGKLEKWLQPASAAPPATK